MWYINRCILLHSPLQSLSPFFHQFFISKQLLSFMCHFDWKDHLSPWNEVHNLEWISNALITDVYWVFSFEKWVSPFAGVMTTKIHKCWEPISPYQSRTWELAFFCVEIPVWSLSVNKNFVKQMILIYISKIFIIWMWYVIGFSFFLFLILQFDPMF